MIICSFWLLAYKSSLSLCKVFSLGGGGAVGFKGEILDTESWEKILKYRIPNKFFDTCPPLGEYRPFAVLTMLHVDHLTSPLARVAATRWQKMVRSRRRARAV